MAVDKGAITDSHVLVLPIEHFPSSLHLSSSTYAEMERYLSALRSCFAAQVHHSPPLPSHSHMGNWHCFSTPDLSASVLYVSAALLHSAPAFCSRLMVC